MRQLLLLPLFAAGASAAGDFLPVSATVISAPGQPALPHSAILVRESRIADVGPRDQVNDPRPHHQP